MAKIKCNPAPFSINLSVFTVCMRRQACAFNCSCAGSKEALWLGDFFIFFFSFWKHRDRTVGMFDSYKRCSGRFPFLLRRRREDWFLKLTQMWGEDKPCRGTLATQQNLDPIIPTALLRWGGQQTLPLSGELNVKLQRPQKVDKP